MPHDVDVVVVVGDDGEGDGDDYDECFVSDLFLFITTTMVLNH